MLKKELIIYSLASALIILILNASQYQIYTGGQRLELVLGAGALILIVLGVYLGVRFFSSGVSEKQGQLSVYKDANSVGLSNRELEVLELMARGHTNQEIADKLFVSLPTIKSHASRIYEKMDVKRRTQAVQKGIDLGLITPDTMV